MDQVYRCCNPRLIRLYDALPPTICDHRSRHWFLDRVLRTRPAFVDRWCVLLHAATRPHVLSLSRFRMEIVSVPHHIIHPMNDCSRLSHSYRRTYMPRSYHIAQELQKYNIPDYRPRQEQYVPSFAPLHDSLHIFPGFKKPSRRSALSNACAATVALPLARPKMVSRIRRKLSGRTTRPNRVQDRRGINRRGRGEGDLLHFCIMDWTVLYYIVGLMIIPLDPLRGVLG
jgi:hypothetical protein